MPLCGSFLLFMFRVCHAVMSVHCSLVVTCWERANRLALLYVKFSCVFVTFPCRVMGQVWYLIVSIPDLCLFPYFVVNGNVCHTALNFGVEAKENVDRVPTLCWLPKRHKTL